MHSLPKSMQPLAAFPQEANPRFFEHYLLRVRLKEHLAALGSLIAPNRELVANALQNSEPAILGSGSGGLRDAVPLLRSSSPVKHAEGGGGGLVRGEEA